MTDLSRKRINFTDSGTNFHHSIALFFRQSALELSYYANSRSGSYFVVFFAMNSTLRNPGCEDYFSSASSPENSGLSALRTSRLWLFLFLLFFSCVLLHKTTASNAQVASAPSVRSTATALESSANGQEDDRAFLRYRGIQGVSVLRGRENTSKHECFSLLTPTAWFLASGVIEQIALPAWHTYRSVAQALSIIQQFIICALPCRAGP